MAGQGLLNKLIKELKKGLTKLKVKEKRENKKGVTSIKKIKVKNKINALNKCRDIVTKVLSNNFDRR